MATIFCNGPSSSSLLPGKFSLQIGLYTRDIEAIFCSILLPAGKYDVRSIAEIQHKDLPILEEVTSICDILMHRKDKQRFLSTLCRKLSPPFAEDLS